MPAVVARAAAPAQRTAESFRLTAPPVDGAVESFFRAVRFLGGAVGSFHRAVDSFHGAAPAGFGTVESFQHTAKPFHGSVKPFQHAVNCFHRAAKPFQHTAESFQHAVKLFQHAMKPFQHAMKPFQHAVESFQHAVESFQHAVKSFQHAVKSFPRDVSCQKHAKSGKNGMVLGLHRAFTLKPRLPGFAARANGGKRIVPSAARRTAGGLRGATTENSPQFQLRVVMPKTGQAPAGRPTDGERFGRPSLPRRSETKAGGTGFDLAGETRS